MSYTVRPVEIPDFNATWDRAQASRQNALAMQMQQREWQQSQAFDNALAANAGGLIGSGAQQRDAMGNILRSGATGARFALPMLQEEQKAQRFRETIQGAMGGGTPAAVPEVVYDETAKTPTGVPLGRRLPDRQEWLWNVYCYAFKGP
jgi:hypothetical protein